MLYRVVLLVNGVYKKTLSRCSKRKNAFVRFYQLKSENNVIFPRKFINEKEIKPVKYEICVTKPTEEGDTFRMLRDDYGKLYQEKPLGDWTILHSDEYFIEERFWVYGHDKKHDRLTMMEIAKKVMTNAYTKENVKQAIVVYNKLVIYNENSFDMIICKCIDDAQRLHHALAKYAKSKKITTILFMGTAVHSSITRMYDLIQENTGWNRKKIKRQTTRP
jgi:hypothetical protein